ncbi:peroxisomal membrane protein 4 isoform X7 [Agelaius tricolor]
MTFLFKSGSFREKLKSIAQATYAHSRNLAYFVFTYKGLLAAQSRLQGKKIPFHSFLAACIGGWLVFGDNNPINSQIIMYLLSRILFGLSRLAVEKGYIPQPRQDPFPLLAALVWGTVLWLFEYHRHTLQPSLQSSMTYLYEDSEVWHDVSDFLIYNKRTDSKNPRTLHVGAAGGRSATAGTVTVLLGHPMGAAGGRTDCQGRDSD